MITTFVILIIVAMLAAIEAALRVRDQYHSFVTSPAEESEALDRPYLEEDIDSEHPLPTPEPASSMQEDALQEILAAEVELPLAASIMVSDLERQGNQLAGPQIRMQVENLPDADLPMADREQDPRPHGQDVLEEIVELEQTDHESQIQHLAALAMHEDSVRRVAAATALGDLAMQVQGSHRDTMIQLLNQLLQDADIQVRVQAAAALGAMKLEGI